MNASKQILTRISNLLFLIENLIENNLDVRRELVRIQSELSNPDVLRDINGIKVYKGCDYVDTTIVAEEKIVIGEELDKSEVFPDEEEEEVEGWNSSFYIQDCGGNFPLLEKAGKCKTSTPTVLLEEGFKGNVVPFLVNATFSVSND